MPSLLSTSSALLAHALHLDKILSLSLEIEEQEVHIIVNLVKLSWRENISEVIVRNKKPSE